MQHLQFGATPTRRPIIQFGFIIHCSGILEDIHVEEWWASIYVFEDL